MCFKGQTKKLQALRTAGCAIVVGTARGDLKIVTQIDTQHKRSISFEVLASPFVKMNLEGFTECPRVV